MESVNQEYLIDEDFPSSNTATAYSLAGRGDASHTFRDLRSAGRARRRLYKEREKYYGYRGVNRGQLGQQHYTPDFCLFSCCGPNTHGHGYANPLPESNKTKMTKRLLYRDAQEYPRPPTYHRSNPHEKDSSWKKRQVAKRFQPKLNPSDYDKANWCDFQYCPLRVHEDREDICYCIPESDYARGFLFGNGEDEGVYDGLTRRMVGWFDVEGKDGRKFWAPRNRQSTQGARKTEGQQIRVDRESQFTSWVASNTFASKHSGEMLYLDLSNGRDGSFPSEDPQEWFMERFGAYFENETPLREITGHIRWSWFQDYSHFDRFGILVEGQEMAKRVKEVLAAYTVAHEDWETGHWASWLDYLNEWKECEDGYEEWEEEEEEKQEDWQSSRVEAGTQDWLIVQLLPFEDQEEWTQVDLESSDASSDFNYGHGVFERDFPQLGEEWEIVRV